MLEILAQENLPKQLTDTIGEIKVTAKNERFCVEIPPEGSEYVHENTADNEFISELIALVGAHGCTMEQITELFYKYSDNIEKKDMQNGEFDCYIRFLNEPDDTYYYCFHDEAAILFTIDFCRRIMRTLDFNGYVYYFEVTRRHSLTKI